MAAAFADSAICTVSCSLAGLSSSRNAVNGTALPRVSLKSAGIGRYAGVACCRAEKVEQRNLDMSIDFDSRRILEEYQKARDQRKQQGLLEYDALKRELSSTTAGVAVAISAYCFVTFSSEVAVSYGLGALSSLGYLQLLYRHVDNVSEDNVPQIFVQRRRWKKRIGTTSNDLQKSIERAVRGSSRALSSPRLVIPAALFGLWGLTSHFAEKSPIHLQVAPLLFGFFAYKAAALLKAYRDNRDLLLNFPAPKGPGDA